MVSSIIPHVCSTLSAHLPTRSEIQGAADCSNPGIIWNKWTVAHIFVWVYLFHTWEVFSFINYLSILFYSRHKAEYVEQKSVRFPNFKWPICTLGCRRTNHHFSLFFYLCMPPARRDTISRWKRHYFVKISWLHRENLQYSKKRFCNNVKEKIMLLFVIRWKMRSLLLSFVW